MTCAIITITTEGLLVAGKLGGSLKVDIYASEEVAGDKLSGIFLYETSTKDLIKKLWVRYDSFVFIMALGIVNRIIKDLRDRQLTAKSRCRSLK